jgi:uncharacterized protein (TIGR03435 family)
MSLLVSILFRLTVATGLGLGAVALARRERAALRHALLAAGFVALLVWPVASLVSPSVFLPMPAPVAHAIAPMEDAPFAAIVPASEPLDALGSGIASKRATWPALSTVLIAAWIAGAVVGLIPVAAGLWAGRSVRQAARPWPDGEVLAAELGRAIGRPIRVLIHDTLPGPLTSGLLCPAIVLPADAPAWTADDLERALVHELAHIRRVDWMSQSLARIVVAMYWCHPLVWAMWRRFTLEAERACDDAVLADADATAYADQLVGLAERLASRAPRPFLAMASRHDLATRVRAVLSRHESRGPLGRRAVVVATGLAVVLIGVMASIHLGAVPPAAPMVLESINGGPRFDVVSIKPCQPEDVPPGARGGGAGRPTITPRRLHVECQPLVGANGLIRQAYGVFANGTTRAFLHPEAVPVEGGPAWVRTDRYSIDATAEGTPSVELMHGPMLQALLEDRFHLKLRRETRDVPVYDLTAASGGPRLKPFDGHCVPVDFSKGNLPGQLEAVGACPISMHDTTVDAPGQTIGDFINFVLVLLDRPVIDKTGLAGRYDIHLTLASDDGAGTADVPHVLAAAVERQLGLKLVPAKGPGTFLVIDRVERPDPNRAAVATPQASRAEAAPPVGAQAATGRPAFEVASVKLHEDDGASERSLRSLFGVRGIDFQQLPLRRLIVEAYGVLGGRILGADAVTNAALTSVQAYDIAANADRAVPRAQLQLMLQALLADRFKLAVHIETRTTRVYRLVVAKGGPNLRPAEPGGELVMAPGPDGFVFRSAEMLRLAGHLSSYVDLPVDDETGLTGLYDFVLKTPADLVAGPGKSDQSALDKPTAARFASALRALGLETVVGNAPVKYLIVDHVERPTPNGTSAVTEAAVATPGPGR